MRSSRFWMLLLFVTPPVILLTIFVYVLSIQSFWYSWFEFSGGAIGKFYGFHNFIDVLTSERFLAALNVTWKIVFWVTLLQLGIGFLMAYALVRSAPWVQTFGRVALFIPVISPGTVIAVLWKFIYSPEGGLVNQLLYLIGLDAWAKPWLGLTETALYAAIAVNIWKYFGLTLIFFYLAMQNVSKDRLEAARVDGANRFQELVYIYLPSVKPILEFNLILTVIGSIRAFDIYNMLTGGGPAGSTTTITKLIVDGITAQSYGNSSALSVMLFVFIAILMFAIQRLIRGRDK